MSFAGKTVLVTGAGSGIGRAMAEHFAGAGAHLIVADLSPERVEETVGALSGGGARVVGVAGDVTSAVDAKRFVDAAAEIEGRIDILCNNAGIWDKQSGLHETDQDLWNRVLAINLTGTFLVAHEAIPLMTAAGGGVIVNTASIAGFLGGRAGAAYTAAKHGVIGLTRHIAAYYRDAGIRCNAICPGPVETRITEEGELTPLGRRMVKVVGNRPASARPAQIAEIAAFLASDASGYVNGAVIVADSGWTVI